MKPEHRDNHMPNSYDVPMRKAMSALSEALAVTVATLEAAPRATRQQSADRSLRARHVLVQALQATREVATLGPVGMAFVQGPPPATIDVPGRG